jgi:hypothetical protein
MADRNQRKISLGDIVTYYPRRSAQRTGLVIKLKESASMQMMASIVPVCLSKADVFQDALDMDDFIDDLDKKPTAHLSLARIGKYVEYCAAISRDKSRAKESAGIKKDEKERARTLMIAKGLDSLKEGDKLTGWCHDRRTGIKTHETALVFVSYIPSSNRIRCSWAGRLSGKTKSWHPDNLQRDW